MFTYVALFALIAAASGSPIVATPYGLAAPVAAVKSVEYDANPSYSYTYSVNDALTGDNKQQSESRQGDVVTGQYSLVEADGTRRIVDYTADPVNGFNAVVRKEGAAVAKAIVAAPVAKVIAPVAAAYHAPIYGAPAAYHAPIYGAPAAYHAPVYGAAAAYHAPVYGAAAAYHAPVYGAAPIVKAAVPYYG